MQRLHPDDLAGHIERNEPDYWERVVLPMEFDQEFRRSALGYYDPRREQGELLFPWLRGADDVRQLKETMDPVEWQTQWQQQARGKGVGVIDADRFRYWSPRQLPDEWEELVVSADLTAKTKGSRSRDWAVLQVWGRSLREYYLLDQSREKTFSLSGMVRKLVGWCKKRREIGALLIENKALGPKVVRLLKKQLREEGIDWVRVVPIDPQDTSKQERWDLVAPLLKDGQLYIPDPSRNAWVESVFLREIRGFPFGPHDDQVDAMTQALIYLKRRVDNRSKKRYGFALKAEKKRS
jgi:predicted phage terminase large subunit-like protein